MVSLGSTEEQPWSRLRAMQTIPRGVLLSVQPEDVHRFLRLLAKHPTETFDDAGVVLECVAALRARRVTAALATVAEEHSRKRKREEAAEKGDGEARDGGGRRTNSRQRARRSFRAQTQQRRARLDDGDENIGEDGSREARTMSEGIRIGSEHQADVPKHMVLSAGSAELARAAVVRSTLVFSANEVRGSDETVREFLDDVNAQLLRRDGFGLSPLNEEVALRALFERRGDIASARGLALERVSRTVVFPGAGPPWTEEEACIFAQSLCDGTRDLQHISRHVLPHRSTRELVVHYYTRYKNRRSQFGGGKRSLLRDHGLERVSDTLLEADRKAMCLRDLAFTAGDGFPSERRTRDAVLAARTRTTEVARRKRLVEFNAQSGRRVGRVARSSR